MDGESIEPNTVNEVVESTVNENVPRGTFDRPESLPEEFWNAEKGEVNLDSVVKGIEHRDKRINDLRTMVAQNEVPEAPEGYEFKDIPEDTIPEIKDRFAAIAHKHKMPKTQAAKVFADLAGEFPDYVQMAMPSDEDRAKYIQEQWESLGDDKDRIHQSLIGFAKAHLKEDEVDAFAGLVYDANSARLMHKLVSMTGEKPIPTHSGVRMTDNRGEQLKEEYKQAILERDQTKQYKIFKQMEEYHAAR